ncbi:hypothetical protein [Gordonia sp. (in: high G+C Gram-positive bacteria)]|uniref:hypothetical protein n=1 Tax=Gordonia sp. (in: high G+C Gram-positive bacteria) TaxID=84139 RepID=UPI0039E7077C
MRITIIAAIAAAAGLSVVAAPVHATVTNVSVNIASNEKTGTGCQYKVTANLAAATDTALVHFYDNGTEFATAKPYNGVASTPWSPKTKGDHVLRAGQPAAGFPMVKATTVEGINTGSGCLPLG